MENGGTCPKKTDTPASFPLYTVRDLGAIDSEARGPNSLQKPATFQLEVGGVHVPLLQPLAFFHCKCLLCWSRESQQTQQMPRSNVGTAHL